MAESTYDLFEVKIIYPITKGLINDEELDEVEKIKLRNDGIEEDFGVDIGYWDIALDPIVQMNPRAFIPAGKDRRKYYTEVVFQSGNIAFSEGKPADLRAKIREYQRSLPP